MRIYIFSTKESFFHPTMFYDILAEHSASIVGAAIFPSKNMLYSSLKKCIRIDGLIAISSFARHGFIYMKKRLLSQSLKFSDVKDVFKHFDVNIDYFDSPNSNKCIERIKVLGVDVVFNNQPAILKKDILSIPNIVFLNRHTSMLPAYRGVDPVFYALLDGNPTIGVSMHSMTLDIDAGNLYAQMAISASKSVFDCYVRAFDLSPKLFSQALENLAKGVSLASIDPKNTKYYKDPVKSDIIKFRKLGLTYL